MKLIRSFAACLTLVLLAAAAAAGQDKPLAITTNKTLVDGVVNAAEYSYSQDYKELVLYVNRTADALYVGVVGNTTGWVAFGLGSLRMDGATIFMGFVKGSGNVQFKPQAGQGHIHKDAKPDVNATVVAYAMKETGGTTTLEVQLKPASYIKAGQSVLQMIYAEGTDDSFIPTHMLRGALSVKLAQ